MQGYLLDTNIIRYWFDPQCQEHEPVDSRIRQLPVGTPLAISAITLGEIEYGLKVCDEASYEDRLNAFIEDQLPLRIDVTSTTRNSYGLIRARLFRKYAPSHLRRKRHPEQLIDSVTGLALGIQENDLWIAAQAVEHKLVLVSNDRLVHVRSVAPELQTENWAVP